MISIVSETCFLQFREGSFEALANNQTQTNSFLISRDDMKLVVSAVRDRTEEVRMVLDRSRDTHGAEPNDREDYKQPLIETNCES